MIGRTWRNGWECSRAAHRSAGRAASRRALTDQPRAQHTSAGLTRQSEQERLRAFQSGSGRTGTEEYDWRLGGAAQKAAKGTTGQ